MIVSAIDGRIRYVHPSLKSESAASAVETNLRQLDSVTRADVNRTTGSLLVLYKPVYAHRWSILKSIKSQIKAAGPRRTKNVLNGRRARKMVKYIMAGTIAGSIGILVAGSERWHYRIGSVFLSALSLHLYQNRKTFLR